MNKVIEMICYWMDDGFEILLKGLDEIELLQAHDVCFVGTHISYLGGNMTWMDSHIKCSVRCLLVTNISLI